VPPPRRSLTSSGRAFIWRADGATLAPVARVNASTFRFPARDRPGARTFWSRTRSASARGLPPTMPALGARDGQVVVAVQGAHAADSNREKNVAGRSSWSRSIARHRGLPALMGIMRDRALSASSSSATTFRSTPASTSYKSPEGRAPRAHRSRRRMCSSIATSKRRHLSRANMMDNRAVPPPINPGEAVEEKVSLILSVRPRLGFHQLQSGRLPRHGPWHANIFCPTRRLNRALKPGARMATRAAHAPDDAVASSFRSAGRLGKRPTLRVLIARGRRRPRAQRRQTRRRWTAPSRSRVARPV